MKLIRNGLGHETVRVSLLVLALLAFFFWDVVFGKSTFLTSVFTFLPSTTPYGSYGYTGHRTSSQPTRDSGASSWHHEPLNRLAARMFKAGQLPLWNPHAGTGVPLAANLQSGALYLLNAPTFIAPDTAWVLAMDLSTLFGLFIAGYFTYLFLRSAGTGAPGALAGAMAYPFGGSILFFLETADWRVSSLIPLLLYAAERLHQKRNASSVLLLAFSVFLAITAGMPETTFFALLLTSLYYLYRVLVSWIQAGGGMYALLGRLALLPMAGLWGAALAAFLIIPFLEYMTQSWNSHPTSTGLVAYPPETAISLLVPYFFGGVFEGWYYRYLWETVPYVGVLVALLAFLSLNRGSRTAPAAWVFSGFAVFYLAKAYGTPIAQWISYLPLFNLSIFPRFAGAPFAFCAAVLAGLGVHNVQQGWISGRRMLGSLGVVLVIVGGYTLSFWSRAVAAKQVDYVLLQVTISVVLLALAGGVLILGQRAKARTRLIALLLVALLGTELFIAMPRDRVEKYDPFTQPPFVEMLHQDKEPFRILGLDKVLYPVTAGVYGLDDIRNLDALYPHRYPKFLGTFIEPEFGDRFTGQDTVYQNKFLDLMNVKYILSIYPLLDRWVSRDLSSQLAQTCRTPASCSGYRVNSDRETTALWVTEGAVGDSISRVSLPLQLRPGIAFVRFEIGFESIHPVAYAPGSEISFELSLDGLGAGPHFSKRLPVKAAASWVGESDVVDLTPFEGKEVTLTFTSRCKPSCPSQVQAAWKNVELLEPAEEYVRSGISPFIPLKENLAQARMRVQKVFEDQARVYVNDSAFPRAFIVHDVILAKSEQEALAQMADPAFDPRRQVVIEGNGFVGLPPNVGLYFTAQATTRDFAGAQFLKREPGYVEIQASADQPGFLVLTDTFYPGWRATVDGKDETIYAADYLFQAVPLTSGNHRVVFTYDPWSYKIGFAIALLALLAAFTTVGYKILRRKKTEQDRVTVLSQPVRDLP
jgi:hypothetical protein